MRNYLILKEKVKAFRSDPEVAEAMAAARVDELRQTTLGAGESLDALRSETVDVEAYAVQGAHLERLDQLAMEHLLGVR
jgi:xylose isomerase